MLRGNVAGVIGFIAVLGCGSVGSRDLPSGRFFDSNGVPEPQVASQSGVATSDGLEIYYEVWGEGEPLLLLPGWGGTTRHWVAAGWLEALVPGRQVVMLDVRGHGKSAKPHEQAAYSYSEMSHDILSVMDHLELERVDLLGYSMGAFIGAYLWREHPERFSSMILGGFGSETAESLRVVPRIVEALRADDADEVSDPYGLAVRRYALEDPDADLEALALSAIQMWPESMAMRYVGVGADGSGLLVINGADDPYSDNVSEFVEAVPGTELILIPETDHMTAFGDPRFKEAVLVFLDRR